jgi:hypothetical protein
MVAGCAWPGPAGWDHHRLPGPLAPLVLAVDDSLFCWHGHKVFGTAWHHDPLARGRTTIPVPGFKNPRSCDGSARRALPVQPLGARLDALQDPAHHERVAPISIRN